MRLSRAFTVLIVALGLAVAGIGYALAFFVGQSSDQGGQIADLTNDVQQQQRLIGALQQQVAGLGGTPLTAPPTPPKAHAIPTPSAHGGDGGSGGEPTAAPRPPTAA